MPKNKELKLVCETRISLLGQKDLDNIFLYIAENNYDSAVKFFKDLGKKFRLLAENPKLGRLRDDYVLGLRSFPYKDYTKTI